MRRQHSRQFEQVSSPENSAPGGRLAKWVPTATLTALAILASGGISVAQPPEARKEPADRLNVRAHTHDEISHPAGSLDPTFGSGGIVITRPPAGAGGGKAITEISGLIIQPDGKLVVVGRAERKRTDADPGAADEDFGVTRYNADGSLDERFGAGGTVITDLGGRDAPNDVALQSDGKIVVVGYSERSDEVGWDMAVTRYNRDGSLDVRFGVGGKVLTDFAPPATRNDYAESVALQPDGKIVVAGRSGLHGGRVPYDFALVRYNTDGTLDRGFGVDGRVLTDFAVDEFPAVRLGARLLFGPVGRILAGYLPVGITHDEAQAVALQSDGKIIVAGSSLQPHTGWDFAVARYNPDGSLDDGSARDTTAGDRFGWDGKVLTELYPPQLIADEDLDLSQRLSITRIGAGHDHAFSVVIQPDGKIVAAGGASTEKLGPGWMFNDFAMVRYNPDGTLDRRFGKAGKVLTELSHHNMGAIIRHLALESDGKIVAAGACDRPDEGMHFALLQYHGDGRLDQDFGSKGIRLSADASSMSLQADGKIVTVGSHHEPGEPSGAIAFTRYEAGSRVARRTEVNPDSKKQDNTWDHKPSNAR